MTETNRATRLSRVRGGGVVSTVAGAVGTATRWGLKLSALPVMGLKYLPENRVFNIFRSVTRTSADFPKAVAEAFDRFAQDMEMLGGGAAGDEGERPLEQPGVHTIRNEQKDTAIVFVHGFGQNSANTWGKFLSFVTEEPKLKDWDVFTVGYTTNFFLDIAGLWSASPPIDRLAFYLDTVAANPPLDRYKSLTLVAHSMGGLVTQRALVDFTELRSRAGHVIFFGTPSAGLKKASLIKSWKRQIRDMSKDSSFVLDVRERWKSQVEGEDGVPPFKFRVVAGDQDELVPPWSSLEPFAERFRSVVPGNHLTIVSPQKKTDLSVQVLTKHITGEASVAGPWNSARVAVEGRRFQQAIDQLWPHRAELDDATLVMLSLALDSVGRRDDAIQVLAEGGREQTTDQMGTLAGRLKRRWLLDRRKDDAVGAKELYSQALEAAEAAGDPAQAYYHAINVAFMALAYEGDKKTARQVAQRALDHCAQAEEDVWRLATEGEANLVLDHDDASIEGYRAALEKNPQPWQITSMFQQAVLVAEYLDNEAMAERLRGAFRDSGS